ncbi:MAG: PQ-loop repeat-containing protein [Deltaproteobacteria bacterium]|nr:MAG: PQ-loop repeat-containing protein [Deltaproteobacteria bacterium]
MSIAWQLIGALAMLCIEASYVPQIVKLYRDKNAEDFSIFFPLLNGTGRVFGLIYTGFNGDIVLALGFLLGIALRLTLLFQVWYYKRVKQQQHEAALTPQPATAATLWNRFQTWTSSMPKAQVSPASAYKMSVAYATQGHEVTSLQPGTAANWCHPGDACVRTDSR